MGEWDAMSYEGKDTILRVVRQQAQRMFALAGQPAPGTLPRRARAGRSRT